VDVGEVPPEKDAVDTVRAVHVAALGPGAEGVDVTPVCGNGVGRRRRQRAEELVLLPGHRATVTAGPPSASEVEPVGAGGPCRHPVAAVHLHDADAADVAAADDGGTARRG